VVEIDLKEELKKGKQTYYLPSLFPKTFAAEAYDRHWAKELEKKEAELEERKAARLDPNVDPEIYEAYVGQYGWILVEDSNEKSWAGWSWRYGNRNGKEYPEK
jgi:hypothetical protein